MIADKENMFKFMDASFPESSRDLILHKGDLDLSSYSRHFGRTPSHSDKHLRPEWELEDPEEDAAEDETSKRPDIAGHPNNNNNNKNGNNNNNNTAGNPNNTEYKIPSGGQVSDSFLLSLRPRTKMP